MSAGRLTPARSMLVAKVCRLCRMRHSRHTFATEMMRSGVNFPALMHLLGHSTPKMTLLYSEFAQTDLQREFRAARSHPRHLVPRPTSGPEQTNAVAPLDASVRPEISSDSFLAYPPALR